MVPETVYAVSIYEINLTGRQHVPSEAHALFARRRQYVLFLHYEVRESQIASCSDQRPIPLLLLPTRLVVAAVVAQCSKNCVIFIFVITLVSVN